MSTCEQTATDNQVPLEIDEDFRNLMPPLSREAYAQLEDSIVKEGCREPLVAWECGGKTTLLDGHNRYAICEANNIPYRTVVKTQAEILDHEAAADWIDQNQLARRNLTPEQFTMVLGRRYNRQKKQGARTDLTSGQNGQKLSGERETTAEKLAKQHGVNERTVRRAGEFVEAVEEAKATDPDIEAKIMQGKGPSRKEVMEKAKPAAKRKKREIPKDAVGRIIPEHLREVYAGQSVIKDVLRDLKRIRAAVEKCLDANDPVFSLLNTTRFQVDCDNLGRTLKSALPHAVCPNCGGDGKDCKVCQGFGLVNKDTYDMNKGTYETAPEESAR